MFVVQRSRPQRAPSAVRHKAALICQVHRCLPGEQRLNQACYLDTLSDWQPMELVSHQRDVITSSRASDQSCGGVLNSLQLPQQSDREAVEQRITVI